MPVPASQPLTRFLTTEDLDALLDAADDLPIPLSAQDAAAVRAVLSEWRDQQAVANLLMHPQYIPADLRLRALVRGLHDEERPYLILAAVVGVAGVDRDPETSPSDRVAVRERVLDILTTDESVIAKRASVTMFSVLTAEDGARVLPLLEHPNETVRHNALAWLFETFDPETASALRHFLDGAALRRDTKEWVEASTAEYIAARRENRFNRYGAPRLAYIPNLSDTR